MATRRKKKGWLKPEADKLLRGVADTIVKYKETYNQNTFFLHNPGVRPGEYPVGLCGTVGCIAGHVVLAKTGYKKAAVEKLFRLSEDENRGAAPDVFWPKSWWFQEARKILGISEKKALALFTPVNERFNLVAKWPAQFETRWEAAGELSDRDDRAAVFANIAKDRIHHFIETGE